MSKRDNSTLRITEKRLKDMYVNNEKTRKRANLTLVDEIDEKLVAFS